MRCSVLDTTVLSNFAHVRRPRLIQRVLGEQIFTTPSIMGELQRGVQAGYLPACRWEWLRIWPPDAHIRAWAERFHRVVDAGEAEGLATALVLGCVFLSDDLAARRLARQHGVRVSGTVGILLRLVRTGIVPLPEAEALLMQMRTHGYRAPAARLAEILRRAER